MSKSTEAESGSPPTRSSVGRPWGAALNGAGAEAQGASRGAIARGTTSRHSASVAKNARDTAAILLFRRMATPACAGRRETCPASDDGLVHLVRVAQTR